MSGIFREYHLGVDHFKQPDTAYGKKAIGVMLIRLLLLEPGTDPMRPNMGIGLVSKYRYMFPDKLNELRDDIYNQLDTYLYPYQRLEVILTAQDKELHLDITINDETYQYVTKEQEDKGNTITLTELKESVE